MSHIDIGYRQGMTVAQSDRMLADEIGKAYERHLARISSIEFDQKYPVSPSIMNIMMSMLKVTRAEITPELIAERVTVKRLAATKGVGRRMINELTEWLAGSGLHFSDRDLASNLEKLKRDQKPRKW